jgi:hypothetical protein
MIFLSDSNLNKIVEFMELIRAPGEVAEVRIFSDRNGTVSGYFNNWKALGEAVSFYDGKNSIFVTINPVDPALKARADNRLKPYAKSTTSDKDIVKRTTLLVDIDPVRASGISTTNDEHRRSIELAEEIEKDLKNTGWPDPIVASSGNGCHLLYKIDLPNDKESRNLVQKILKALDFQYSSGDAKVDISNYNSARISKLIGTVTTKGDDTKDRPHRRSKIMSKPADWKKVEVEQMKELAQKLPQKNNPQNGSHPGNVSNAATAGNFVLKNFIDEHNLQVARKSRWNDNATRYILEECPWRDHSDRRSAYIIEFDSGALAAGCHHDSCSHENWFSLREELDSEYSQEDSAEGFEIDGELEENSQINKLLNIIEDLYFFLDELEEPNIVIPIEGHKELWHYESHKVEQYLYQEYLKRHNTVPNTDSMNTILKIIATKAHMDKNRRDLYRRIGKDQKGNFYYDLCDENWSAVKIEPDQIELVDQQPLIFTRNKNMKEQLRPVFDLESPAESLAKILKHVTLEGSGNQLLYQVYLVTNLIPDISKPVLVVHGQKGSAKSTFLRITKHFVDPARMDLLTMPNSKKDMIISLQNNYFTCYDNLSSLSKMKSDLLCIAATGGAFSTRTLYTTKDETIMSFKRPVAIDGINLVTTEPDLIDRSLIFELDRIKDDNYVEDSKIWAEYQSDLPEILGGVMLILSKAMEIYPEVEPERLGRMAAFSKWGYAIAEAMGLGGELFLKAYFANQDGSNLEVVESHPLAAAMVKLMERRDELQGTVAEVLNKLISVARKNSISTDADQFPGSASALSRRLKEVKSNLEDVGIYYEKKKKSRAKILTITNENAGTKKKKPDLPKDLFNNLDNDDGDDESNSFSLDLD